LQAAIAAMRELTDEIKRDAGQSQNKSYQAAIDAALTKLHQLQLFRPNRNRSFDGGCDFLNRPPIVSARNNSEAIGL
jgi:hypothetical protein